MDEASSSANCYSFETRTHRCDLISIVGQHADVMVASPDQDLTIFVPSQEDMSSPIDLLVKQREIIVAVVRY